MQSETIAEKAKAEAEALADRAGIDIGDDRDMFVDDLAATLARFAALSTDAEPGSALKSAIRAVSEAFDPSSMSPITENQAQRRAIRSLNKLSALYAEPVKTAPAVAVKATFEFDRYINGTLMAEGVTINNADSLGKASAKAAKIASRGPNGEVPVLVIRSALSAQVQDVAVDGADIGRCIRSLSVEHPLKWPEAEKKPSLRGWFVGQVMKRFDGKPDEKLVRELIDIVFAMYPASPASKHGDEE